MCKDVRTKSLHVAIPLKRGKSSTSLFQKTACLSPKVAIPLKRGKSSTRRSELALCNEFGRNPLEAGQKFNFPDEDSEMKCALGRNPLEAGQKFNDYRIMYIDYRGEMSQSP